MRNFIAFFCMLWLLASCTSSPDATADAEVEPFTFVFMTDIHLRPELQAAEGFQAAIDKVNELDPDFVITGGDLVDDVLGSTPERADTLFNLYAEMLKGFRVPVYNTVGNHDHYGFSSGPHVGPDNPDYGEGLFENRIGNRYYAFDHRGWHFMILDVIEKGTGNYGDYIGRIDSVQLDWVREDLESVEPETPIVIVTHIPLVSIFPQIRKGPLDNDILSEIVTNQRDLLVMFRNMNLKLVLQGHVHAIEEIQLQERVKFITGGAVSGQWWRTPDDAEFQEGFVKVTVTGDEFTWEYVDFGWETGITSE